MGGEWFHLVEEGLGEMLPVGDAGQDGVVGRHDVDVHHEHGLGQRHLVDEVLAHQDDLGVGGVDEGVADAAEDDVGLLAGVDDVAWPDRRGQLEQERRIDVRVRVLRARRQLVRPEYANLMRSSAMRQERQLTRIGAGWSAPAGG